MLSRERLATVYGRCQPSGLGFALKTWVQLGQNKSVHKEEGLCQESHVKCRPVGALEWNLKCLYYTWLVYCLGLLSFIVFHDDCELPSGH